MTAKHCLADLLNPTVHTSTDQAVALAPLVNHPTADVSLARIEEPDHFAGLPPFSHRSAEHLDQVLVMGYPRIALMEPTLVSEPAEIAACLSPLVTSTGRISGSAKLYSAESAPKHWLVSAQARGGNSGGPVVGADGKLLGIVTSEHTGIDDAESIPGYKVAVDAEVLGQMLAELRSIDVGLSDRIVRPRWLENRIAAMSRPAHEE